VDFASGDDPISVALYRRENTVVLRISNTGPLLPAEMKGRLFESMVSVRKESAQHEPHLGLGLYIVRQIAEFHGGSATATNRADGKGVEFELWFPVAA
jgi:signal transduction histidine kinase